MTNDIPNTFKNKVINLSDSNKGDLFTPADNARLTKDHAKSALAHSPSELGTPTKTNPRTDRGTDKQARINNSDIGKNRFNTLFKED